MNWNEAYELLKKYNKEQFHIEHAVTVSYVMEYFAKKYNENEEFWSIAGLLHDIDYEMWPQEHCKKCVELLNEANANNELIHAVCSHGYGLCSDVEPSNEMEKILFATDELTGLIWAAAKMRPSHSTKDMEVSSLKKKFKDKKFAAGCSRDVIRTGAERLDWDLDKLFDETIQAMRYAEDKVKEKM